MRETEKRKKDVFIGLHWGTWIAVKGMIFENPTALPGMWAVCGGAVAPTLPLPRTPFNVQSL